MIVLHLQCGCHSNKMMSLSIVLAAVFLGTRRFFSQTVFCFSSYLSVCEVRASDLLTFLPPKRYLAGILIKSKKIHFFLLPQLLSEILYSFQPSGCKVLFGCLFVGVENKPVKGISIRMNSLSSDFTVLYKFASFWCHPSPRKWVIKSSNPTYTEAIF